MQKKHPEVVFHFLDNSICKCCNKLPSLKTEYLSSASNELTNSVNISHMAQRDFFKLNCLNRDE